MFERSFHMGLIRLGRTETQGRDCDDHKQGTRKCFHFAGLAANPFPVKQPQLQEQTGNVDGSLPTL